MKCFQCKAEVPKGRKNFCSDACRRVYDIFTWGEGKVEQLSEKVYYAKRDLRMRGFSNSRRTK